jgi:hypothetical protein
MGRNRKLSANCVDGELEVRDEVPRFLNSYDRKPQIRVVTGFAKVIEIEATLVPTA